MSLKKSMMFLTQNNQRILQWQLKDRYKNEKLVSHPDGNATQDKINQAKQNGYVLNDDWKTQFTIKAYHGCRRVKQVVHEVVVELRDGTIS